jgi:hypothetical protein
MGVVHLQSSRHPDGPTRRLSAYRGVACRPSPFLPSESESELAWTRTAGIGRLLRTAAWRLSPFGYVGSAANGSESCGYACTSSGALYHKLRVMNYQPSQLEWTRELNTRCISRDGLVGKRSCAR